MSFSSDTKKELCKVKNITYMQSYAECYGMLIFCRHFSTRRITFTTESYAVASRFCQLISQTFGAITEQSSVLTGRHGGGNSFTISVPLQSDCERIYLSFGYTGKEVSRRINRAVIEDDNGVSAFLRGAFLCCGSVNNPEKDYHLEFSIPHKNLCNDLIKTLSDVEQFSYLMKVVERKGSYIAYIKDSEHISDLLAFMEAPTASMNIIETKIIKEIRNDTNRRINSEVANMKKTITASMKQIKAIEHIRDTIGLESLSDELKQLAELRLENPEISLRGLGEMVTPPISRSGINHRINKIIEISESV